MKFGGVIFDFNGTLFWDSDKQEKSWMIFSEKVRGYAFTVDEMAMHMHGKTNEKVLEYLMGQPPATDELPQLIQQKETIYRDMCLADSENLKLAPGAVKLLNDLKRQGIPRTIATASEIVNVKFFFEVFQLANWFDLTTVVYDDGSLPGKPQPDSYQRAAGNLALTPELCIVVEDSLSGIEAARRAGIGKIVAIGPREKHDKLMQIAGVSQVISDFNEMDRNEWQTG